MKRERKAVDIDDVLADTTDALRVYVNEAAGIDLTIEDYRTPRVPYWGYYEHVWTLAGVTDHSHLRAFQDTMIEDQSGIALIPGAVEAMAELSESFDLVAITSRDPAMQTATEAWLSKHFRNVFSNLIMLNHARLASKSKGQACLDLGADTLVDDSPEHCVSAEALGVGAVLFGDHGWHHVFDGETPRGKTWPEATGLILARSGTDVFRHV